MRELTGGGWLHVHDAEHGLHGVGGSGAVVVFVLATDTTVPGLSSKTTSTLTLFTVTVTGNLIGSGLSVSGMSGAYATRPRRSRIFLSAAP